MKNTSEFNFDLKQLKSFLTVLDEKSFTRASRKLKLGQATISHHIQQIEESLGVKIIKRSSKDLSITREGIIFKEFCDKLFNNIEELQIDLKSMVTSGKTVIAASTIPSSYLMPYVIANLKKAYPDFSYSTYVTDSREVIELIKEGTMEIGVVGKSMKHPQLDFKKIYSDTIVLVAGLDAPDSINKDVLRTLPFVFREKGSGTRRAVEEELTAKKVYPADLNVVYECSTSEGIKEAVIAGMGFGFISRLAIGREIELNILKIVTVEDLFIERDFFVCFSKNKDLSRAGQLFYEELMKLQPAL